MNRQTRRLSKIPEEVREEVIPFYLDRVAIATEKNDSEKISKLTDETAERVRTGLAVSVKTFIVYLHSYMFHHYLTFSYALILLQSQPRWSDMDANQHVNNVKYIGWILEVLNKHKQSSKLL